MEFIEEYKGHEFDWAVEEIVGDLEEQHLKGIQSANVHNAEKVVLEMWDYICDQFNLVGIKQPDQQRLITAVRTRLDKLKNTPKLSKGALTPREAKMLNILAKQRRQLYAKERMEQEDREWEARVKKEL